CNEGEPAAGVDPEGSVSVIDLSGGVAAATVATAGFTAYNDRIAFLKNRGVRLWFDVGTSTTVAQDFEPEYLTIIKGTTQAVVGLQEANAFAVVDFANPAAPFVKDITGASLKDHMQGQPHLTNHDIVNRPALGNVLDQNGQQRAVQLGGFSGLY